MIINNITKNDLRTMKGKEGLILQGCGGDPKEWLDGINELFTKNGILVDGSKFDEISVFEGEGNTCILFPFKDTHVDIGKLAMWRLQTYNTFYGTWLTDYVDNKLGGFADEEVEQEKQKPDCNFAGQDGNIFNLMGIASSTLKRNGMSEEAKEMVDRITSDAKSYYEALGIISEYVNIIDGSQDMDEGLSMNM